MNANQIYALTAFTDPLFVRIVCSVFGAFAMMLAIMVIGDVARARLRARTNAQSARVRRLGDKW